MANWRKALRLGALIPMLIEVLTEYENGRDTIRAFREGVYAAAAGKSDYVLTSGSDEAKLIANIIRRIDDLFNRAKGKLG